MKYVVDCFLYCIGPKLTYQTTKAQFKTQLFTTNTHRYIHTHAHTLTHIYIRTCIAYNKIVSQILLPFSHTGTLLHSL